MIYRVYQKSIQFYLFFFNNFIFTCRYTTFGWFFCKILYFYSCNRTINVFFSSSRVIVNCNSSILLFRIIKIIYFDSERETFDKDHNISLRLSLLISTVLIIFYFIYPSTLTEIIAKIIVI